MNRILFFPIRILLSFLVFTEILFFISPIVWNINNGVILILYMLILNLFLYQGYKAGLRFCVRKNTLKLSYQKIKLIIFVSLIIKIIFLLLNNDFSLMQFFNKIVFSLSNAGEAYYSRNQEVHLIRYVIAQLLSPITFIGLVMGTYYWKELSSKYKFFYLLLILIEILSSLSVGVRKGLFDIIIFIFCSYILSNYQILDDGIKLRKLKRYLFFSIMLFLVYFLFSNLSRMYQYDSFVDMLNEGGYKINDYYLRYVPEFLIMPIYSISSYLCQGYYALAKALEIGFIEPNILATNFFTVNVAENMGANPLEGTYMNLLQMKFGISPTVNWHSIYVWFANGFTFIGVPFIIYLIGFVLSNSWKKALYTSDHIAIPLFVILFQMVLYFFANNQVFSFSFVVISFLLLVYFIDLKKM